MRDKGLKFVIADSAFKRKQVDARACWLDTGEHHPGLALRTSGARNCSEWNGARKALRLGHDAFPRIGGSATLSLRNKMTPAGEHDAGGRGGAGRLADQQCREGAGEAHQQDARSCYDDQID